MIKRYIPWLRNEAVDFALDCFCMFVFVFVLSLYLMR